MLLEINNVVKSFPVKKGFLSKAKSFVHAVDNIDLTINKGENISLVGESGCGKTTLAKVILKLLRLNSGQMTFDGRDATNISGENLKDYRRNVQMVFQDPFNSLDPRFTVRNIVKEAMTLDKKTYNTADKKEYRIRELFAAVNLKDDMLSRYPHEFSGGERQRIAIARALVLNPKLLILDEAVSSLDVIIQEQIIHLLMELQEKYALTYLFISHNLRVVKKISHRVAVMYKGKIVELGPTQEIIHNPLHPYTKELLAAAMDYQSIQTKEININRQGKLKDHGDGHFVIEP